MNTVPVYRALVAQQFALQRVELVVLTVLGALVAPGALALATTIEQRLNATSTLLTTNGPLTALAIVHLFLGVVLLVSRQYMLDASTRHTYAAILPIPRGAYAVLRIQTGLTLALLPIAGFALGTWITASAVALPAELYAYPAGLTARYGLCFVVAYALMFALQYGAGRHASKLVIALLIGVLLLVIGAELLGNNAINARLFFTLAHPWSPFHVFLDEWRLFDV
jgi:hypothetical protein